MGYRLTRKAAADVSEIYAFSAEQFGVDQADAYHTLLENTFEFLARNPLAARGRPELSPPLRIHPVQSHLVLYKVETDGNILIIRVRHGHEDWADPVTLGDQGQHLSGKATFMGHMQIAGLQRFAMPVKHIKRGYRAGGGEYRRTPATYPTQSARTPTANQGRLSPRSHRLSAHEEIHVVPRQLHAGKDARARAVAHRRLRRLYRRPRHNATHRRGMRLNDFVRSGYPASTT